MGELVGTVVAVQVQRSPLKPGSARTRAYEPWHVVPVERLQVGPLGATGVLADGSTVLDVHHAHHPQTRDARADRGLSFLTTADYARLRARYGDHLVDGVAGESVRLAADAGLPGRDLAHGLTVETAAGELVPLTGVRVATPCVEFTRFVLGRAARSPVDAEVRSTLRELDGGVRGVYGVATRDLVVSPGDRVWLG